MKTLLCSLLAAFVFIWQAQGQVLLRDPSEFSVPTVRLDFETFPDGKVVPAFQQINQGAWTNAGINITRDVYALPWTYPVAGNSIPAHSGSRGLSGSYNY